MPELLGLVCYPQAGPSSRVCLQLGKLKCGGPVGAYVRVCVCGGGGWGGGYGGGGVGGASFVCGSDENKGKHVRTYVINN